MGAKVPNARGIGYNWLATPATARTLHLVAFPEFKRACNTFRGPHPASSELWRPMRHSHLAANTAHPFVGEGSGLSNSRMGRPS